MVHDRRIRATYKPTGLISNSHGNQPVNDPGGSTGDGAGGVQECASETAVSQHNHPRGLFLPSAPPAAGSQVVDHNACNSSRGVLKFPPRDEKCWSPLQTRGNRSTEGSYPDILNSDREYQRSTSF